MISSCRGTRRTTAILKRYPQLNKLSINDLIRHECQNGIRGGCFFISFDAYTLSKYYSLLTQRMNATKKKQIEKWCEDYLRKDNGEPYSFEEVVKADYCELQSIKKQIDDNSLEQYNRFLYNHNKEYKTDNKKGKKKNTCYIKDTLYNSLSSKKIEAKLLLLKNVGISVCPYCNRNYIFSNENVITCQLDHFYNKDKYPILAVSFFNLIPCCPTCNRLKGTKDFAFYPYDQNNKAIDIMRFSYKTINSKFLRDKNSIIVEASPTEDLYSEQLETLKISKLYELHNDIVFDIIRKSEVFSDVYINSLQTSFPKIFSSSKEVKELLFGVPLSRDDIHKRPLSKLTQDIVFEINEARNNEDY